MKVLSSVGEDQNIFYEQSQNCDLNNSVVFVERIV
jgi:hypothetical protein